MTINLENLARADSPLADPGGYDLWRRLSEAGDEAMRMRASVPMAMLPILKRREVFEVYSSLARGLERHLFGSLISRYIESIEKIREDLVFGLIEGVDVGLIVAKLDLNKMRDELSERFRGQLDRFRIFHDGLSSLLGMLFAVDRGTNADVQNAWRDAYSLATDLMRDADNVLTSLDVTCMYLLPDEREDVYTKREARTEEQERVHLERNLGLFASLGYSLVALAINVNWMRAKARGTRISSKGFPDVRVPEPLRVDLFRVMNELLLNAVRFSDLKKKDRRVWIKGERRGSFLRICVSDNGRGISEEDQRLDPDGRGWLARVKRIVDKLGLLPRICVSDNGRGILEEDQRLDPDGLGELARVKRIADRRGWKFSARSRGGKGMESVVSINMGRWPGVQPSSTGEGFDAEGFPSEAEIASGAHLTSQSNGVMALTGASLCFARMV